MHIQGMEKVEESEQKLNADLAELKAKYEENGWPMSGYEHSAQIRRRAVEDAKLMKEQGYIEKYNHAIVYYQKKMGEYKDKLARIISQIFRLFLRRYSGQSVSNWTMRDYVCCVAEKHQIPVYVAGENGVNLLWPKSQAGDSC